MKSSVIKTLLLVTCASFATVSMANSAHQHSTHQHAEQVMIHDAKVRVFLPGAPSTAGYFTLVNHTDKQHVLVSAELEGAGRVEIHEHIHKEDMMKMQKVDKLKLAPGQQVSFQPGGYHLMIFEPNKAFEAGQQHRLTLYFENGKKVQTKAEIVALEDMFGDSKQRKKQHQHSHH
ncbi:copper chaperone PCu(A)C [Pseudoalteromonas sp. T1lg65]|uniref:copper chaperone PCu(A)C n=1 Tax=Pseudoalteromonas sp. T1lg65 TaxID=2077101 RepID=UPI003F799516